MEVNDINLTNYKNLSNCIRKYRISARYIKISISLLVMTLICHKAKKLKSKKETSLDTS